MLGKALVLDKMHHHRAQQDFTDDGLRAASHGTMSLDARNPHLAS